MAVDFIPVNQGERSKLPRTAWTPRPPARGTQSFVGTMSAVWQRPALTLREIAWRWAVGLPLLVLVWWQARRLFPSLPVDTAPLAAMTVFRPLEAFRTLQLTYDGLAPVVAPVALWLVPVCLMSWAVAWSAGRGFVLRHLDRGLRPGFSSLLVLRLVRTALLLAALGVWWLGARWAAETTISGPGSRGDEPNLVLYCALVICGSLLLFVGWAAFNWIVDAAPLLVVRDGLGPGAALRAVARLGHARGKFVEVNLVMSIVKIALLVLAMVFSACPLPFEGVTTQGFLVNWWIGVAVLYFLASDYFHVVRSAAYLALFREGDREMLAPEAQHTT